MTLITPHLSTQVGLFQPAAAALPVGVAALILVALLLLAFGLGALLARRPRPAPAQPSPWLADVLNALPFPAALVSLDGSPLTVNAEAASWLEAATSGIFTQYRGAARRRQPQNGKCPGNAG